ncbi:MAG: porin [Pseudomonadota bacterium]
MKSISIALAALSALAVGTAVQAQDIDYATGDLSFSRLSGDGGDLDVFAANVAAGYRFDAVDVFGALDFASLDIEGDELQVRSFTAGAGYTFGQLRADASYTTAELEVLDLSADTNLFEVGLGFDNGAFSGRLGYAFLDDEDLGADALYGVALGYDVSSELEASVSFHRIEGATGGLDDSLAIADVTYDGELVAASLDLIRLGDDASAVAVSGAYDFGQGYGVIGGFGSLSADGDQVATLSSLGGFYRITDDLKASVEYFRVDADDLGDVDGFTLLLSYDLGRKPTARQTQLDRVTGALEGLSGFGF